MLASAYPKYGHGCCVLPQLRRNYFVQRVGCCVVVIEVSTGILHDAERRYSCFRQRSNIGPRTIVRDLDYVGPETLQYILQWLQQSNPCGIHFGVKPKRMASARIALDRAHMIGQLCLLVLRICIVPTAAVFFVYPSDYAQRALWAQM